jgi:hypothetical protein
VRSYPGGGLGVTRKDDGQLGPQDGLDVLAYQEEGSFEVTGFEQVKLAAACTRRWGGRQTSWPGRALGPARGYKCRRSVRQRWVLVGTGRFGCGPGNNRSRSARIEIDYHFTGGANRSERFDLVVTSRSSLPAGNASRGNSETVIALIGQLKKLQGILKIESTSLDATITDASGEEETR